MSRSIRFYSSILFVIMLSFAGVSASAQTWLPPQGPPPEYNVAPPIHEGALGQAKYWGSVPQWSLGSLYNLVEGLISEFVVADGQGVAATQFCLITDPQAFEDSNWDFSTLTDCISSWSELGGGGGGGGEDGDSLLPLATAGQTLFFNSILGQWEASEFFRSVDGGTEDSSGDKIMFGRQIPGPNNDIVTEVGINGSFKLTNPETPGDFYDGKILGSLPNSGGTVSWVDPVGFLPEGTSVGQIMYWNQVDGEWNVSTDSGFIEGLGFVANYTNGKKFSYLDNNGSCPEFNTIAIENGFGGILKDLNCTDELRVNTTESKVYVKSLEHAFESRVVCAGPEGDLNLCDNLSTGTWSQDAAGTYEFQVPFGVYEIEVTAMGGGGGGGAGGMGRSLSLINPQNAQQQIYGGGGGGGGGGRGEVVTETVDVEPGQIYRVVIGNGGKGGCPERYNPNAWWGSNSSCGGSNSWISTTGNGNNGQSSYFDCEDSEFCDTTIDISASGGGGGVLGSSLWGAMSGAAMDFLNISGVVGGPGGWNGDGTQNQGFGLPGDVWYINGSEDPDDGIDLSCDIFVYNYIYAGGSGGAGSDGALGGDGGSPMNVPDVFGCYLYSWGQNGHGDHGSVGNIPGSGGGGGGGGNSQNPGNQNFLASWDFGYGGLGGNGAAGKIDISW